MRAYKIWCMEGGEGGGRGREGGGKKVEEERKGRRRRVMRAYKTLLYTHLNIGLDDFSKFAVYKIVNVLGAAFSCGLHWYVFITVKIDTSVCSTKQLPGGREGGGRGGMLYKYQTLRLQYWHVSCTSPFLLPPFSLLPLHSCSPRPPPLLPPTSPFLLPPPSSFSSSLPLHSLIPC